MSYFSVHFSSHFRAYRELLNVVCRIRRANNNNIRNTSLCYIDYKQKTRTINGSGKRKEPDKGHDVYFSKHERPECQANRKIINKKNHCCQHLQQVIPSADITNNTIITINKLYLWQNASNNLYFEDNNMIQTSFPSSKISNIPLLVLFQILGILFPGYYCMHTYIYSCTHTSIIYMYI